MPEKKKQTKSKSESPELKAALKKAEALQEKSRLKRDKAKRRDAIQYGILIAFSLVLAILAAAIGAMEATLMALLNILWMVLMVSTNRTVYNQAFVIDVLLGIDTIESDMLLAMREKEGKK